MSGLRTPHDILSAIVGVFIAAIFLLIAMRCLRSGKSGPRIDLPEVAGDRLTNPKLYWSFQVLYGAFVAMGLSFAVFICTNEIMAVIISTLLFGFCFAGLASMTGFYTLYGFRSGKGLMVGRGGVTISDLDKSPKWFWATQIQNIVMTAFFGAIGIGTMVFAIWVEYSS